MLLVVFLILLVGALTLYLLVFRQKGQFIPKNFDELACVSSVTVMGNSMEPTLKAGSVLLLNKCLDKNNLTTGNIILFEEQGVKRLGRVRERLQLREGISYTVSRDNRSGEERTVLPRAILAVN